MSQYIVIVTGMRDWEDKQQVHDELDRLFGDHLRRHGVIPWLGTKEHLLTDLRAAFVVRHGKSGNVDIAANDWAIKNKVTCERFQAQWHLPGGGTDYSAGPRRNREMAQAEPRADLCLAFWNGQFQRRHGRDVSGTHNMICEALLADTYVKIVPPKAPR